MFGLKWSSSLWPPGDTLPGSSLWRPMSVLIERVLPYALLATAALLSFRADTLPLVGIAAVWLLATFTFRPKRLRDNAFLALVSFAGLLVIASLLMLRDPLYLVFMITGFFHALHLRPVPLALFGLVTASLLLNTLPNGGPAQAFEENGGLYTIIILIQSGAIGGGSILAAKVARQNEARRQALEELAAAHEENAGLHRQLLAQAREAGILDERQRLSQEIHDTLAQGFTGIITQLEAAEQAGENAAERRRHMATASALARENLAEARRSVRALQPEQLDSAKLADAVDEVARRWSERAGVAVEFTATGNARELHPEIEATLLRVTQEALANVEKHAAAQRAGVTLSYMEGQVTLDVRDDGVGFAPENLPTTGEATGFGLPGMCATASSGSPGPSPSSPSRAAAPPSP